MVMDEWGDDELLAELIDRAVSIKDEHITSLLIDYLHLLEAADLNLQRIEAHVFEERLKECR
jgi:hypothetical protein